MDFRLSVREMKEPGIRRTLRIIMVSSDGIAASIGVGGTGGGHVDSTSEAAD